MHVFEPSSAQSFIVNVPLLSHRVRIMSGTFDHDHVSNLKDKGSDKYPIFVSLCREFQVVSDTHYISTEWIANIPSELAAFTITTHFPTHIFPSYTISDSTQSHSSPNSNYPLRSSRRHLAWLRCGLYPGLKCFRFRLGHPLGCSCGFLQVSIEFFRWRRIPS